MDPILASEGQKPHAICIPFPAQGHVNPMLQLAKLLRTRGFHITFVNNEHNHIRLLRSRGPASVAGGPSFRFETIPDGLPPTDADADTTQDTPSLAVSMEQHSVGPFKELITRLNNTGDVPSVSCVVSDAATFFTIDVAHQFGIPHVLLWTASACGLLAYAQFQKLLDLGIIPFKESNKCGEVVRHEYDDGLVGECVSSVMDMTMVVDVVKP
ncbi:UDP-glycosyltransferase 85A5 [Bienertia sinuspersici]